MAGDDDDYVPFEADDSDEEDAQEEAPSVASRAPQKKRPAVATTARKAKKKKAEHIGIGRRVKVRRDALFHILAGENAEAQKLFLKDQPKNKFFYGKVTGGNQQSHYKVEFDLFPHKKQEVEKVRRGIITVVGPNEEEPEFDHKKQAMLDTCAGESSPPGLKDPTKESIKAFCDLDKELLATAKIFEYKYGRGDDDLIKWKILGDTEYITEDPLEIPETAQYQKEIDWSDDMDHNTIFFEHFFPSIKGHGKIIDEFLADTRSGWSQRVHEEKIKFHDPDAEDPDYKVRLCYTLIIAAAAEVETGVDNLFK